MFSSSSAINVINKEIDWPCFALQNNSFQVLFVVRVDIVLHKRQITVSRSRAQRLHPVEISQHFRQEILLVDDRRLRS
jgi:hypothetical protein